MPKNPRALCLASRKASSVPEENAACWQQEPGLGGGSCPVRPAEVATAVSRPGRRSRGRGGRLRSRSPRQAHGAQPMPQTSKVPSTATATHTAECGTAALAGSGLSALPGSQARGTGEPSTSTSISTPGCASSRSRPRWAALEEREGTPDWHFQVLGPVLSQAEDGGKGRRGTYPLPGPLKSLRERAVDTLVRLHKSYQLRPLTLYLAVLLVDRSLTALLQDGPLRGQLIGRPRLLAATALTLAAKFEDEAVPEFASLQDSSRGEFHVRDIHITELQVLAQLGFHLHMPLALHHLHWLLHKVSADPDHRAVAEYVCEAGLHSPELPTWKPLEHAAAAVVLAGMMLSLPHSPELQACFGIEGGEPILQRTVCGLCRVLYIFEPGCAVFDKHSHSGLAPRIDSVVCQVTGKARKS